MPVASSPLSLAQERLWFIEQFSPGTATYNTPIVLDVTGPLEHSIVERALGEMVRRHEPLRTVIRNDGGRPQMAVLPDELFVLPVEELAGAGLADEQVTHRINDEIRRPVDLERGPIFRGRLLRLDDDRHVLVLVVHHIAFDGWSMGVFLRELSALYAAFAAGEPSPLAPLPTRYADVAEAEREQLSGDVAIRQLAYWREHLQGPLPVLTLPTDRPRPPVLTSRGQSVGANLPDEVMARLQDVSRQTGATLFMTLLALYGLFLHRLSAQTDIIVGVAVANRMRREVYPLIGFFANTLPLRMSVTPEMTVRRLLTDVTQVALNAYANQDVPFARIVEAANPKRDLSRSPLVQTLFTFNNTPRAAGDDVVAGAVTMRRRPASTGTAKADLTLLMPRGAAGRVIFETNADLFDAATGARMLHEFCELLAVASEHVDVRIDQLTAMSAPAGVTLGAAPTLTGTGESAPYPRDETVTRLFERQARRTPDAPAVADGTILWTYRELNERANRLGHVLRARRGDDRSEPFVVGVCLERTADAVVALLAILKAGGAYVPLDPSFPPARLMALATRADLRLVVTSEGLIDRVLGTGATLVVLEGEASTIARAPATDPPASIEAGVLAYVLFTSGSTGTPKPVGVPHRAIVRLVYGLPYLPLGEGQTVLHSSPLSFDAATFEIWGPLLHGGCVAIAPPLMLESAVVARVIAAHQVTVMWLTASLFNAIVDERVEALAPVRYLLTGGETLSAPHVARAMAALPGTRFFNGYGPTEATTFTTCHEIVVNDTFNPAGIPIGRPLLNTRVYALDEGRRPVDPGDVGELWIGGDGLALGYLDDAERTAARFVPDPFAGDAGARMYRSGDRGRILPDGTVEFLGRFDDQIKLRGFRIEPGEVEAAIGRHEAVAQCAVVAVESHVGRVLVAFYVPAPDADDASPRRMREFLRDRLPEYMIPARWTLVRSLPLLITGKIDRQALKAQAAADVVDRAELESLEHVDGIADALASMWRELLGADDVKPEDHFFDSGGHSLLAVQMLSKVKATFGVEIGVRALFEAPTLAGLSQVVAERMRASVGQNASRNEGVFAAVEPAGSAQGPAGLTASDRRTRPGIRRDSREDVAAGLLDIWCELLGTSDVGPADDFFDLGGHSLLATRLSAAIEQRFGVVVPLSALFTHGTIDALTELLFEVMPADGWTPIVPIQPGGSERPLFLVHGIGGEVISFQLLARHLGPEIPIFGIEADRRLNEDGPLSVEGIASTYVAALTRVDPDGPYRIGGYSGGGLIALEIAQQLRRAGRSVSSLVMLDAPAKTTPVVPLTPVAMARLIRNGLYWLVDDDFLRSGWAIQRARVRHRFRVLTSRGAPDIRDRLGLWELPASTSPFIERMSRMLRAYQPQPYAGAITVISARTHSLFYVTGKDLGWTRFARGRLTTRIVRGAHDTILREPRVKALAAILRETLRADG